MVLARRGARWKAVGRNRIARSWQDSIGRVTADWETGTDDAGDSKCCSSGYGLVAVCPEACTVTGGKSINEIFKECFGWVRDAARLMGESKEVIGKVKEAWIQSSVFGSDARSAGCPYGGGTLSADAGGCRHELSLIHI